MFADMAELVDAPDLGSGFARSEGSIPFIRTLKNRSTVRGGAIFCGDDRSMNGCFDRLSSETIIPEPLFASNSHDN